MHHGACSVLAVASMSESPYLVALALVEFAGRRALPLTGKSLSLSAAEASDPGETGRSLALELLLRLWQRSEDGPLQRAAADASLLLVEMPLDTMTEQLPRLKADWILSGDTAAFLSGLDALAMRGWRVAFAKYEPVSFIPWP
jgi:hypothetical protein